MRARNLLTLAAAALALAGAVAPAGASEGDLTEPKPGVGVVQGQPVATVRRPGTPGTQTVTPGAGITTGAGYSCTWYPIDASGQPVLAQPYDPPPPDGTYAWLRCTGPEPIDGPRTRQSGGTAAAVAIEHLDLPGPSMAASPSITGTQLVGVPVWFWITDRSPRSATAQLSGTTSTVTATPGKLVLTLADGTPLVECADGGVAYDASRPASAQSSRCTYTFRTSSAGQPNERFTVRATLTYDLSWTTNNPPPGAPPNLPTLPRTSTFTLRVAEAQALVTG